MDTSGDVPNEFIAQFHNLAGDLIGERKHNLYKLIKDPALFSTEQQLDAALKGIQPRTYLESLFKLDLLIYFKRTSELTEILKGGNEVFISKILKQSWYFREAFNDMDAQSFTNEFLPNMSYAMRMKLLKRITNCWNEEKTNSLFEALYERYGLRVAVAIFHACSKSKIEEVLRVEEIILRPNQVKSLFDKDPSLFKLYVEHANQLDREGYACDQYDELKVLNHVAIKNPALLLQLEEEDKVRFRKLGRRTSKRLVDLVKEDIPKDIERYTRLFNKSVVVRRLGNDFKTVYLNLFPKKIDSINMRDLGNDLLKLCSPKRKWAIFTETFSKVLPNNTMDEALLKFHESFLKLNPGKEIIHKWAEIKYNDDKKKGETFLKYMEPSKAIPLIKEKINVTSDIYNRNTASLLLIETCAVNEDLKALEDVLKYICIRHRNEDSNFRMRLYNTITTSFKMETFNENHWKYINEQIKIDRVKKDLTFWSVSKIIRRHLEFLFKNNKDSNAAIIDYIGDVVENNDQFSLELDNALIEKQIFVAICKLYPEAVVIDSEKFETFCKTLIADVISFSLSKPAHCINLTEFPVLHTFINVQLNKREQSREGDSLIDGVLKFNTTFPEAAIPIENSALLELLTLSTVERETLYASAYKMFTKKERSVLENEVLTLYFEKLFDICPHKDTVRWFLRNEPRTLIPYFDKIAQKSLEHTYLFDSKLLKLYSHFDFDRKVCELYKAQLADEERDDKEAMFKSLVMLLPTTDFIEIADGFRPKKEKLDLDDEEMKKTYKLQCELAKMLHKVQEPSRIIALVLKFCAGDYLPSALPSLYGVFYKSAEKLLYPYVDELSNRGAVSVKKHALFLSCQVLDKNTVLNLFKSTKQTNVSGQKHQFSAALKYFLNSPSQEFLTLVIESMSTIDKNDTETLEKLKDIVVPLKYRPLYIEKCWGFYESLAKSGVKVREYLNGLLRSTNVEVLKALSRGFVVDVITRYLPLPENVCLREIEAFTMTVLEQRETERSNNFEVVFKLLLKMTPQQIRSFFNVLFDDRKDKNRAFVGTFEQYWNKHFTMTDFFEEHIAMKLLIIHLDCIRDPKLYAENVVACLGQLVSEFGLHVFKIFANKLSCLLSFQEKYLVLHNILLHKLTPNTCILVLEIMEAVEDDSVEFEVFDTIMRLLETVQDSIVQAYYKKYLLDNRIEMRT